MLMDCSGSNVDEFHYNLSLPAENIIMAHLHRAWDNTMAYQQVRCIYTLFIAHCRVLLM